MSVFIIGRQPAISLAELEALFGGAAVTPIQDYAAVVEVEPSAVAFSRIGGSLKAAKILTILPGTDVRQHFEYINAQLPAHVAKLPEGKVSLGFSLYGLNFSPSNLQHQSLQIKKTLRAQTGRSVRIVPNKTSQMSSAQVLHNHLTGPGAMELLLIRSGDNTLLAQTFAVQDLDAYTARDQARPARDARVGMLPPKLAQIIINLATAGQPGRLLDPFCGSGVILQEAALMGYQLIGSDIEPRMVQYTTENLEWLSRQQQADFSAQLAVGDATDHHWPEADKITAVASETFLGQPMTAADRNTIIAEQHTCQALIKSCLQNLAEQLPSGSRLCLAVPAWFDGQRTITLPLIDLLPDLGYNLVSFRHATPQQLIYHRPAQVVGRQLITLIKE